MGELMKRNVAVAGCRLLNMGGHATFAESDFFDPTAWLDPGSEK